MANEQSEEQSEEEQFVSVPLEFPLVPILQEYVETGGSDVRAIVVSGSIVYVGGEFSNVGGGSRSAIAALDAVTGLATAWDPSTDGDAISLAIDGSTIYVGGSYSSIGGQPRDNIAAIDAVTGLATAWND